MPCFQWKPEFFNPWETRQSTQLTLANAQACSRLRTVPGGRLQQITSSPSQEWSIHALVVDTQAFSSREWSRCTCGDCTTLTSRECFKHALSFRPDECFRDALVANAQARSESTSLFPSEKYFRHAFVHTRTNKTPFRKFVAKHKHVPV